MRSLAALPSLFLFGWRTAFAEKATLVLTALMFTMYILIFASIWKYTSFVAKGSQDITFTSMVWYIVTTELVSFGGVQFREQVRSDILSQQLAGLMGRPLPYWLSKITQLLGRGFLHLTVLSAVGTALALALTGHLPYLAGSPLVLLLPIILGMILTVVGCFMIGLLDVWGPYARPAYWIWQKALFVLGGLMLPLTLYPEWLRNMAFWTPFPSMVYLPAALMLQHDTSGLSVLLLHQLTWLALLTGGALGLHTLARYHFGRVGD